MKHRRCVVCTQYPLARPLYVFTSIQRALDGLNKRYPEMKEVLPDPALEVGYRIIGRPIRKYGVFSKRIREGGVLHLECKNENDTITKISVKIFHLQ